MRLRTLALALGVALLLQGCGGGTPDAVRIGVYALDESRTLGAVVGQSLDPAEHTYEIVEFGDRSGLLSALDDGTIDVAVEYLGSLLAHHGHAPISSLEGMLSQLSESRPDLLRALAPAHAGRGAVVTAAFSGQRGIRSVAALSEYATNMTIGGPADCPASPTCLLGFGEIYGIAFGGFVTIDDPEQLAATLAEGGVDLAVLPVTHPAIESRDLVVLGDDLGMHVVEWPILLGRPELETMLVNATHAFGSLDTEALRHLNRRAAQLGRDPAVAEYLQSLSPSGGEG